MLAKASPINTLDAVSKPPYHLLSPYLTTLCITYRAAEGQHRVQGEARSWAYFRSDNVFSVMGYRGAE